MERFDADNGSVNVRRAKIISIQVQRILLKFVEMIELLGGLRISPHSCSLTGSKRDVFSRKCYDFLSAVS